MTDQLMLHMPVEISLSANEKDRFEDCERVIERGIKTFVDVGIALLEIRDNRYYREEFGTFEDYCREKWGWERRHSYRLIDAAKVVENVSNWTQIHPSTESQARPLTSLEPEQQREAWQIAVETAPEGKITAAHVQSVVDAIKEPKPIPHVLHNSGNNEWYTPSEYIEAARSVMGEIDLDPASSEVANKIVRASVYFTADDDGLLYSWDGRVWMNPPYASDLIGKFAEKLANHFCNGEVTEAIVLVNNATETAWFSSLVAKASAVIFPRGRVRFWDETGNLGTPLQGQAVIYLGNNTAKFLHEFSRFGWGAEVCNR